MRGHLVDSSLTFFLPWAKQIKQESLSFGSAPNRVPASKGVGDQVDLGLCIGPAYFTRKVIVGPFALCLCLNEPGGDYSQMVLTGSFLEGRMGLRILGVSARYGKTGRLHLPVSK